MSGELRLANTSNNGRSSLVSNATQDVTFRLPDTSGDANAIILTDDAHEITSISWDGIDVTLVNGDVRVDGDSVNGLLFIDESTNHVGIGTTSPSQLLEVNGESLFQGLITANRTGGFGAIAVSQSGTNNAIWYADGEIQIGGTLGSTPNVRLRNSGEIQAAAGDFLVAANGRVEIYRQTGTATNTSLEIFSDVGGAKTSKLTINAGGDITIPDGNVITGNRDTTSATNAGVIVIGNGSIGLQRVATANDNNYFLRCTRGRATGGGSNEGDRFAVFADGDITTEGTISIGPTTSVGGIDTQFIMSPDNGSEGRFIDVRCPLTDNNSSHMMIRGYTSDVVAGATYVTMGVRKNTGIRPAGYINLQNQATQDNVYYYTGSDDNFRTSNSINNVGTANGTVVGTQTSDSRLKKNIRPCNQGLSEILQLQPRFFEFINNPDVAQAGFIAQEVQSIIPEAVYDTNQTVIAPEWVDIDNEQLGYKPNPSANEPTLLAMDYVQLIPALVNAIKELKAEITELQSK